MQDFSKQDSKCQEHLEVKLMLQSLVNSEDIKRVKENMESQNKIILQANTDLETRFTELKNSYAT